MSDRRQREVDFLHHWAVVWSKLSGNRLYMREET